METDKKLGKNYALIGIASAVIVGLILFFTMRSSTVSGRVTWQGTPVAAGQIVFESADATVMSQISEGYYEIKHPRLAGTYNVRIEVHFVDPSEAAEFYKNLTQELNPDNRFNPQKDMEPGSEVVKDIKPANEMEPSTVKRAVFKEELGNGWNKRNYDLPLNLP